MKNNRFTPLLVGFSFLLILGLGSWFASIYLFPKPVASFMGTRAFDDVNNQVGFGPRTPDSPAHEKAISYIQKELLGAGWSSFLYKQFFNGHYAYNIMATRNKRMPTILLGAHYDSRIYADNDPITENRTLAVPGANDGASGVAVLLEIARSLPKDSTGTALLFIDIEDNGRIPGWDWIQGSRAFVESNVIQPKAVIIIDMIGDKDLNIFVEKNSDAELTRQIWKTAKVLGYESTFIPEQKYQVLDDHVPFLEKGFHAVDIIDLDYKYWHTINDTPDKISASSLQKVGDTLLVWIHEFGPCIELQNCPVK
jgi:hypothetical protein